MKRALEALVAWVQAIRRDSFPAGHHESTIPSGEDVVAYYRSRATPPRDLPGIELLPARVPVSQLGVGHPILRHLPALRVRGPDQGEDALVRQARRGPLVPSTQAVRRTSRVRGPRRGRKGSMSPHRQHGLAGAGDDAHPCSTMRRKSGRRSAWLRRRVRTAERRRDGRRPRRDPRLRPMARPDRPPAGRPVIERAVLPRSRPPAAGDVDRPRPGRPRTAIGNLPATG